MSNKVSYIIQLKNQFSKTAEKVNRNFSEIQRQASKTAQKIKAVGKSMTDMGKSLSTRVTLPLIAFGGVAATQSAKLETMRVSFETMTGSVEQGRKTLEELVNFTATTPFQLESVGQAAKQLLAFGVQTDDLTSRLRMLGDISAGANVPISDMAQIFGKAKAKGKLMTEEILQLSDRGVPVVDTLSKRLGVTKAQVFKLASESKISFQMLVDSMKDMTQKGGMFFKQTEKQALTLGGVFSTLKDNMSLTTGVFGDIIVEVFDLKSVIKSITDGLSSFRSALLKFKEANPVLTKVIGFFVLGAALIGPLLIVVGQLAIGIVALKFVFAAFGTTMLAVSLPILAVTAAVGLLITAGFMLWKNWDGVVGGAKAIWADFSNFISGIASSIGSAFTSIWESAKAGLVSFVNIGIGLINSLLAPLNFVAEKLGFGSVNIQSIQAPSAPSQSANGQFNGELTVKAESGTSVRRSRSRNRGSSNIGMNMVTQ